MSCLWKRIMEKVILLLKLPYCKSGNFDLLSQLLFSLHCLFNYKPKNRKIELYKSEVYFQTHR